MSNTNETSVTYNNHVYDLPSVVQPREGDIVEMLVGPEGQEARLCGPVWNEMGVLRLGFYILRWSDWSWHDSIAVIRIVTRATLSIPDGIYRQPDSDFLWFVKDGRCDTAINTHGEPYQQDSIYDHLYGNWTRVGDLPVIEKKD